MSWRRWPCRQTHRHDRRSIVDHFEVESDGELLPDLMRHRAEELIAVGAREHGVATRYGNLLSADRSVVEAGLRPGGIPVGDDRAARNGRTLSAKFLNPAPTSEETSP